MEIGLTKPVYFNNTIAPRLILNTFWNNMQQKNGEHSIMDSVILYTYATRAIAIPPLVQLGGVFQLGKWKKSSKKHITFHSPLLKRGRSPVDSFS